MQNDNRIRVLYCEGPHRGDEYRRRLVINRDDCLICGATYDPKAPVAVHTGLTCYGYFESIAALMDFESQFGDSGSLPAKPIA